MKKYINSFEELHRIKNRNIDEYYLNKLLLLSIKKFNSNNEEMIYIYKKNEFPFITIPFWEDKPLKLKDKLLQKLLDAEQDACRKYIKGHPKFTISMRKTVLDHLLKAQSLLPNHIKIVLKAGYRPIEVQLNLFLSVQNLLQKRFPFKHSEEVYKLTSEYVSDPRKNIPPHTTGGAIDVCLYDLKEKTYVDMGSPLNLPDDKSWTYNIEGLTTKQINNRMLLTKTMLQAGFANLASEWWHYSYGDLRWAIFYKKKTALYNSIT